MFLCFMDDQHDSTGYTDAAAYQSITSLTILLAMSLRFRFIYTDSTEYYGYELVDSLLDFYYGTNGVLKNEDFC